MSRSYRKPYASICGIRSAHADKTFASRAYRRLQNRVLRSCQDWDEFSNPCQYEASGNDVWGWSRDGNNRLQRVRPYQLSYWQDETPEEHYENQRQWILQCSRK